MGMTERSYSRREALGLLRRAGIVGVTVVTGMELAGCASAPERPRFIAPDVIRHMETARNIEAINPQPAIWRAACVSFWNEEINGSGAIVRGPNGTGIITVKHVRDSLYQDPTRCFVFIPGLERVRPDTKGIVKVDPDQLKPIETGDPDNPWFLEMPTLAEAFKEAEEKKLLTPLEFGEKKLRKGLILHSADTDDGTFSSHEFYKVLDKTHPEAPDGIVLVQESGDEYCSGRSGSALLSSTVDGKAVSNKIYGVVSAVIDYYFDAEGKACSDLAVVSPIR